MNSKSQCLSGERSVAADKCKLVLHYVYPSRITLAAWVYILCFNR